jgi:hypothetical protein
MSAIEDAFVGYSHSRSFRLFHHTIRRTRALLKWSSGGLEKAQSLPTKILDKLARVKAGTTEPPDTDNSPKITLTLTANDISTIEFALKTEQELLYNRMHFHLHEVILMALWSSFESYLQGVIQQVYAENVDQLASDKQVTYRELVAHSTAIGSYLIEREISDFGRLSLAEMIRYIKARIKYDFSEEEIAIFQETYFLRNVAAHNSGFVRSNQLTLIPAAIGIHNNQIDIPLEYLESKIASIEAAVERMDSYVIERWSVPKSQDALFDDLPKLSEADSNSTN